MTLNEVIDKINAAILGVPQEERIRKLVGKTSFLQGLLRQEMVESGKRYDLGGALAWLPGWNGA